MDGLQHFSPSFSVGLVCFAIGFVVLGSVRGWRLDGDAVLLFLVVIGTAFVGFVSGFYGPIFFSPSASQGPLLGIFITGPLGAVLGLIASLIYILKIRRRSTTDDT